MDDEELRAEREARVRLAAIGFPKGRRHRPVRGRLPSAIRLITQGDPEWPVALDDLDTHAPECLALWIAGREMELHDPVTITGSRASTS